MQKKCAFLLTLLLSTSSFSAVKAYKPPKDAEKATHQIQENDLKGHIRFLSSDLLEGRGTASRGSQIAQEYIATEFEALGLKPAFDQHDWFQPFQLMGVDSKLPKRMVVTKGASKVPLTYYSEYIGMTGSHVPMSTLKNAEIVFVGYGIQAPEFQWDDYKGVDVKGKILLMMNNDPANDPTIFAGKTRLYYGRWSYKFEIAEKLGAAGAIVIHTKDSAGYPFQVVQTSWSGEQFELAQSTPSPLAFKGWVTDLKAREIVGLGGFNLDTLRAQAEKRDFKPVPIGAYLSASWPNKLRKVTTTNVAAILPGNDPELSKEAVVFMAHYDHLGVKSGTKPGEDNIYNGAADNGTGTAGLLALAKAFSSLEIKPKRSTIFLAVAAEEDGLFGSLYFSQHPPLPAGRIAAAVNMDTLNTIGATRDITFIGKGKSNALDEIVESVAMMQDRIVKPDQFPDKGFFYRADQFSTAKAGIPSIYLEPGIDVIGMPEGYGKKKHEEYEEKNYHQPSDEIKADWRYDGLIKDLSLIFYVGYDLANTKDQPSWNKGDEFEAARLNSFKELKKK